ncbi:hypothetical protein DB346_21575 [Verrucomicrobia bacterium LW23]|nr:hypothetical protein DB346_21575 [Verrucomicrobia bacterium LW23]
MPITPHATGASLAAAALILAATPLARADIPPAPPRPATTNAATGETKPPTPPPEPVGPVEPLPPAPAATPVDITAIEGKIRVACVGDSITAGAGAGKGKAYPTQLQELLGDKWDVKGYGLSGHTLMNSGNAPYMKKPAFQQAQDFKPHVVIIMLGTNDTKPQNWEKKADFVPDYEIMIAAFAALDSKPKIYLCRPCPVPGNGNFKINEAGVREQAPLIDKLVADHKLAGVIDMHNALADKPQMLPDRVHPNAAGARVMAETAYAALTGKAAPAN